MTFVFNPLSALDFSPLTTVKQLIGLGWASVVDYGAVGDGTTDDLPAINLALASGKNIFYDKSKTYLINGTQIVSGANQAVYLNGATIKRAAQISTTLTQNIVSGDTVIHVASTTGFVVGQTISFTSAGTVSGVATISTNNGFTGTPTLTLGDYTVTPSINLQKLTSATVSGGTTKYLTKTSVGISGGSGTATMQAYLNTGDYIDHFPPTITAVNAGAGTITLNTAINTGVIPFVTGDTVYTCGAMFRTTGGGNHIIGPGTLDGNSSNNAINRWQSTAMIETSSDDNYLDGFQIQNAGGEGIVAFGSYHTISNIVMTNLGGNGVHFTNSSPSNSIGIRCENVTVINPNLDISVGHANGGIIWSDQCIDTIVTGCLVDGSPLYAYGSIDSATNNDIILTGNVGKNCLQGGIGAENGHNASSPVRLIISNNKFYNCGMYNGTPVIYVGSNATTPTTFTSFVSIVGNLIDSSISLGAGISMQNLHFFVCNDNIWTCTTDTTAVTQNLVGITAVFAGTGGTLGGTINGNQITGGVQGISTQGASALQVCNNTFYSVQTCLNILGGNNQTVVTGNIGTNGNSSTTGALISSNVLFANNDFSLGAGGTAAVGLKVTGSNNQVFGNFFTTSGSAVGTGILVTAATTGNWIENNSISSRFATDINWNSTVPGGPQTLTTLNGTTAGTLVYSMLKWLPNDKKFKGYFSGYENNSAVNQTVTFPVPFVNTPIIIGNDSGLTITASTTTLTITAPNSVTLYSGNIIVEGI